MLSKELITPRVLNRFNSKIRKVKGCWKWTGAVSGGYGVFTIKYQRYLVHRIAYLIKHGELQKTDNVSHSCKLITCVNPEHLQLNIICRAKLTTEDVIKIIELISQGHKARDLAIRFNVTPNTIRRILRGETWKSINYPPHSSA